MVASAPVIRNVTVSQFPNGNRLFFVCRNNEFFGTEPDIGRGILHFLYIRITSAHPYHNCDFFFLFFVRIHKETRYEGMFFKRRSNDKSAF